MSASQVFIRVFPITALLAATIGCASLETEPIATIDSTPTVTKPLSPTQSAASDAMYELLAGELAGRMGDVEQAVDHYSRAAQLSDDPQIAERATRIALYAGAGERALENAQRWERLAPNNLEAQQTLALLYVRHGRTEEAIRHLERVVSANEKDGEGFLAAAAVLSGDKDPQRALATMGQLVARHKDDPQAHLAYANLALKLEDYPVAVEASNNALALDPNLTEARIVRAQGLVKLGDTERALQELAVAARADPDNFELQFTYGRMLVQAREYDKAQTVFANLIKEHPDHPELLYTLGLLSLQQERYTPAKTYFRRLGKTGKRVDEASYYMGRIAEEQGLLQKAAKEYEKVGEGEYYMDAQVRVGQMYIELEQWAKAQEHFNNLRDRASDPATEVKLYLAEGQVLRDAKKYREAMSLYNRALTEHPSNPDLLYARALIAEKLGRVDLLERDLKAILATDPENATALNALGYTLADRNMRIEEALGYIQRALEIRPNDPTVIDSMGWVQYRMGNYEQAEQYLRQAYALLQDPEIAGHLSELMWVRGNRAEALGLLKEALEKNPEDDYLRQLERRFAP